MNYIGKKWQNKLGTEYLRRMNLYQQNFKILQHKKDDKVIMFKNIKSKFKCANKYNVYMSFKQIELYIKSFTNLYHNGKYVIPEDEKHWFLALKHNKNVSQFLHEKYKRIHKLLTKKRIDRMKKAKAFWYEGINYAEIKIHELRDTAKMMNIPLGRRNSRIPKKKLVQLIIKEKKKSDEKKKKEEIKKEKEKLLKMNKRQLLTYCKQNDINIINNNQQKKEMIKIILKNIQKRHQDTINAIKYIPKNGIPKSLEYLNEYPLEKSWYDINFDLFDSKFARLQAACTCRSGAQIPGCCAHISTCLWLIYYVSNGNLYEALKEKKRDEMILKNINNLTGYKQYKLKNKHNFCVCKQDKDDDIYMCDKCKRWYHASCLGAKPKEIQSMFKIWYCKFCKGNSVWMVRNT